MKKLYSTIMMLAMMIAALSLTACGGDDEEDGGAGASASIYLEKAGTLSSKISKSQASELLKLKLSGHMDARDFDFIKWKCMKIEVVDLADIVIDKYVGADGTNEGYDATYEANEIPLGAFFYWTTSRKYNYEGMPKDEGMASLKKIVLPQGIKAIRRNAFARAYNLTEINIPEGVEAIDYVAFAICTSLEELRLPSTLKTVGKLAFADMSKMKRLYVSATTPPTASSNSFQGITDATLYVPNGTESLYRNATGWNTFTQIVGFGDAPNDNTNTDFGKIAVAVDLGLSVKWASWNIGASKIADYGGLYGAGDPTGLLTSTNYGDYYWEDGVSICGTEYDLAHVKWGDKWQMPTIEQLKELKEKCTWEHDVTIDSVIGSVATGPNGNTLFIPYAGCRRGSSNPYVGKHSSLWSGDVGYWGYERFEYCYKDLDINYPSGNIRLDGDWCYDGQSIRPVYVERLEP